MNLLAGLREAINTGRGRRIAILAAAAVALLGAVLIYTRHDAPNSAAQSILDRGAEYQVVCPSCHYAGITRASFNARFPVVCPNCKKKEARHAMKCVHCKKLIELHENSTWPCPLCGKSNTAMPLP